MCSILDKSPHGVPRVNMLILLAFYRFTGKFSVCSPITAYRRWCFIMVITLPPYSMESRILPTFEPHDKAPIQCIHRMIKRFLWYVRQQLCWRCNHIICTVFDIDGYCAHVFMRCNQIRVLVVTITLICQSVGCTSVYYWWFVTWSVYYCSYNSDICRSYVRISMKLLRIVIRRSI